MTKIPTKLQDFREQLQARMPALATINVQPLPDAAWVVTCLDGTELLHVYPLAEIGTLETVTEGVITRLQQLPTPRLVPQPVPGGSEVLEARLKRAGLDVTCPGGSAPWIIYDRQGNALAFVYVADSSFVITGEIRARSVGTFDELVAGIRQRLAQLLGVVKPAAVEPAKPRHPLAQAIANLEEAKQTLATAETNLRTKQRELEQMVTKMFGDGSCDKYLKFGKVFVRLCRYETGDTLIDNMQYQMLE